jgi:hypothetical protein
LDARLEAATRALSEAIQGAGAADPAEPADGRTTPPWATDPLSAGWLPPDALMSAARAMAAVERTRQLGRWWPPAAFVRPVRPVPALGAPAASALADECDTDATVQQALRARPTRKRLLVVFFAGGLAVVTLAVGVLVGPLVVTPPGGEQAARLEAQAAPTRDDLPSEPPGSQGEASPVPLAAAAADGSSTADPTDGRLSRRPR